jgi:hypothetical protein
VFTVNRFPLPVLRVGFHFHVSRALEIPWRRRIILGGAKIASISLRDKAEELIRMNLS